MFLPYLVLSVFSCCVCVCVYTDRVQLARRLNNNRGVLTFVSCIWKVWAFLFFLCAHTCTCTPKTRVSCMSFTRPEAENRLAGRWRESFMLQARALVAFL